MAYASNCAVLQETASHVSAFVDVLLQHRRDDKNALSTFLLGQSLLQTDCSVLDVIASIKLHHGILPHVALDEVFVREVQHCILHASFDFMRVTAALVLVTCNCSDVSGEQVRDILGVFEETHAAFKRALMEIWQPASGWVARVHVMDGTGTRIAKEPRPVFTDMPVWQLRVQKSDIAPVLVCADGVVITGWNVEASRLMFAARGDDGEAFAMDHRDCKSHTSGFDLLLSDPVHVEPSVPGRIFQQDAAELVKIARSVSMPAACDSFAFMLTLIAKAPPAFLTDCCVHSFSGVAALQLQKFNIVVVAAATRLVTIMLSVFMSIVDSSVRGVLTPAIARSQAHFMDQFADLSVSVYKRAIKQHVRSMRLLRTPLLLVLDCITLHSKTNFMFVFLCADLYKVKLFAKDVRDDTSFCDDSHTSCRCSSFALHKTKHKKLRYMYALL